MEAPGTVKDRQKTVKDRHKTIKRPSKDCQSTVKDSQKTVKDRQRPSKTVFSFFSFWDTANDIGAGGPFCTFVDPQNVGFDQHGTLVYADLA